MIATTVIDLGRHARDRHVNVFTGDVVAIKEGGNHHEWHGTSWAGQIVAHRTNDSEITIKPIGVDDVKVVPISWIAGRYPGTKYLPGRVLCVDGYSRQYEVVNAEMSSERYGAERYEIHSLRQRGGKHRVVFRHDGEWYADAKLRKQISVTDPWNAHKAA